MEGREGEWNSESGGGLEGERNGRRKKGEGREVSEGRREGRRSE